MFLLLSFINIIPSSINMGRGMGEYWNHSICLSSCPCTPEGRSGMSDVSPLPGISGLSFDSTLLSSLLFFCLVLLLFLSYLFLPAGPFF